MRYQINKKKFLSVGEKECLEKNLNQFLGRVDSLVIHLLLKTGARSSEILLLTKEDLNSDSQSVFIKGIKGSNDREIPLPEDLFSKLMAYSETVQGEILFPFTVRTLRNFWHRFRPVNKGLHSLRHTFAIELFKKTKDIRLVQVALGHRNIQNTLVYAEYQYQSEELRRLIV